LERLRTADELSKLYAKLGPADSVTLILVHPLLGHLAGGPGARVALISV
jgi:hypothetical protein